MHFIFVERSHILHWRYSTKQGRPGCLFFSQASGNLNGISYTWSTRIKGSVPHSYVAQQNLKFMSYKCDVNTNNLYLVSGYRWVSIRNTSYSSNCSKCSRTIHDTCITFYMTFLCQIWTPAGICGRIILWKYIHIIFI